jgi:hypothetical protein
MRLKTALCALLGACALLAAAGCGGESGDANTGASAPAATAAKKQAGPLPENGYKAQVEVIDPPARLKAGEKTILQVKVKNISDAQWYARGGEVNTNPGNQFFLAVGDRWLKPDGQTLITDMDGRRGLERDLKPGEEEVVPLQINALKEPGDYVLEVDMIQEQVTFFRQKGSAPAKYKVTVTR